MAINAGNDGAVYVGANAVASIDSFNISQNVDEVESTAMGDTYKSFLQTFLEWTTECNMWWDPTDTNGQGALTIGATVTLNLYPNGNGSGEKYYTGEAIVTALGTEVSRGAMISRSASFRGTGALTEATVGS